MSGIQNTLCWFILGPAAVLLAALMGPEWLAMPKEKPVKIDFDEIERRTQARWASY